MLFFWKLVCFHILLLDSVVPSIAAKSVEQQLLLTKTNTLSHQSAHRVKNLRPLFLKGSLLSAVPAREDDWKPEVMLPRGCHLVLLRELTLDDTNYYVAVDAQTLISYLIEQNVLDTSFGIAVRESDLPYFQLLVQSKKKPIERINHQGRDQRMVLSLDFCPSNQETELNFLESLPNSFNEVSWIAFLSGRWMESHLQDLHRLRLLDLTDQQKIIFANHSYQHLAFPPFMADLSVDFESDVLRNEEVFLKFGLVPSVFYRFPGLQYNQQRLDSLRQLGYIAISSQAWLAKKQLPVSGSIILLHGNGNERQGINSFQKYLLTHHDKPQLIDLRAGLLQSV